MLFVTDLCDVFDKHFKIVNCKNHLLIMYLMNKLFCKGINQILKFLN